MLRGMSLVAQWERIQTSLPANWEEARLLVRVEATEDAPRAASLLGSLAPGRAGRELRFHTARSSGGPAPAAVTRALGRLDGERIRAQLELTGSGDVGRARSAPGTQAALADAWDAALADLPSDWSDIYAGLQLTSSDHLDPAALALAPLNPASRGGLTDLRFRCARRFGYGASPGMVRRCLARLDERGIPGKVSILRSLSDTKPVGTQGPVWYDGGNVV
jgi:hypothetical protein